MATITLKYQKNQSHEIRIEDLKIGKVNNKWTVDNNTTSFFGDEYKEAIEMVNAIIALCNGKKEDKGENNGKKNNKENGKSNAESDSINNRILFVGQRGTGKTSAMTSFAKGLDDAKIGNDKALYFKHLPMIDPSNFDNNTNILLTVITMMFSEAKELMKENGNDEDIISKRESLLKQFDVVFKSLKAITGSDKPTFTLEGLNEKSRALQMRTGMHNLVKHYIEFYNKVKETNISYLVLQIDDIDMTVSHVPEMLEQLRKYLDLDNLLILMSANLGQLYNEMYEYYSKAFKETLNDRNRALSIDVEDLASKYLLKLFPTSRRIRVEHSVSQLINSDIEVNDEGGRVISSGKLQNIILSLIWQKTRLLFVPKDADKMLHPIIPTNLRELMQFLDMLTSLDEVAYEKNKLFTLFTDIESYGNCEKNIKKFKKYILHNWIPNRLSVEEELVFDNIPTDITEINKHLINSINVIGTQHKEDLMSREVGLDMIERNAEDVNIDRDIYTMVSLNDPKFIKANKISDIFNQPSNYSYGDLLLMIDKYETYFESERDRRFSNAIKIYYSILLFETMFFDSDKVNYTSPKKEDGTIESRVDDIIPIQQLIGGTIYYPNYFEIITNKYFKQKGPSYDAKRAFYHKVKEDETDDMPLFSVLYYGDIRPDRYDTKHVYNTTFKHDAKVDNENYKTFDIMSIINNMLNPWQTITRAQENQYDIENWGKLIKSWKENCVVAKKDDKDDKKDNIDENKDVKIFPNTILPFYSVDMMLRYIRKSFYIHEISKSIEEHNKLFESEESAANWLGFIGYENGRIDFDNVKEHMEKKHRIFIEKSSNNKDGIFLYSVKGEENIYITFYDLLRKIGIIDNESKINTTIVEVIAKATNQNGLEEKLKQIIFDNDGPVSTNEKNGVENVKVIEDKINNNCSRVLDVLKAHEIVNKNENAHYSEYIIDIKSIKFQNLENDEVSKIKEILNNLIGIRVIENGSEIKIFNDSDKKLFDNISILVNAQNAFVENVSKDTLKGKYGLEEIEKRFRDYLISQIMKLYSGGQREQEMMIKGLYRYKSITEMYRYLVNVLWKDAITEYCIRLKIQNYVHTRDFVELYYKKLWEITDDGLKSAFFKDDKDMKGTENTTKVNKEEAVNKIKIYKNIFDNAVKYFIKEED